MKYSETWLREWVNPEASSEEVADRLTMAGLEVDSAGPLQTGFSGPVAIGRVQAVEPVEGSRKLNLCTVDDGNGERQVICGAANVRAGLLVALALPGSRIGELEIAEREVFGVHSRGMICSASELGLAEESDGILELPADAPLGTALADYLALHDYLIEVDLTPNRGDCLSIAGAARELGVIFRCPVQGPAIEPVPAMHDGGIDIEIADDAPCGRYLGRVVRGIDASVETPAWIAERLRRADVKLINIAVDITNYVMLELGQPMHAFDLAQLQGGVQVRMARDGERLAALNGETLELRSDTMLIADQQQALAIAGVIGGAECGVSAQTRDVLLESAWFDPVAIAGKARSYNLTTDSAHRFERGVDPALSEHAMERATALLIGACGGEAGPVCRREVAERLPCAVPFQLRLARVNSLLGVEFAVREVEEILQRLGCTLAAAGDGCWQVTAPSWRFDLEREEDLVEEIARIHGYNRLPSSLPPAARAPATRAEARLDTLRLKLALVDRGYTEAITYSFVEPRLQQMLAPDTAAVELQNPISADMAVMRTGLWPGLIRAAEGNLNRQQPRVRLFEIGQCFLPSDSGVSHVDRLGLVLCGTRAVLQWQEKPVAADFFDLKGDVESLLALGSRALRFEAAEHPALHPGQSARIVEAGQQRGWLGRLHPRLQAELDLDHPLYLAELDLDCVRAAQLPKMATVSRYPAVRRDLALVVDRRVPVAALLDCMRAQASDALENIAIFDIYSGEGIDPERKSVAFALTFLHSSHTLSEHEVAAEVDAIVGALKQEFDAKLRA